MDMNFFLNIHAIKQHPGQTDNYVYLKDESAKPKEVPKTLLTSFLRKTTTLTQVWALP